MILDILINGAMIGGIYAILAVGFSLIFGVAKIFNIAHTAFYMIAAFFMLIGTTMLHFSLLPSLVLSISFTVTLGILCFKFFLDRVKEHETAVMIITIALAMLFQEILILAFGTYYRGVPPFFRGFVEVIGTRVSYQRLFAIGSCALILIGLWLLLSKTKLGHAIRAVAQDREIANLMGINVSNIFMMVMAISVTLAGIAGIVMAPIYTVSPFMWMQPLIIVLAAVILGGLGSVSGSVIGAFILGYTETFVVFLIPGGAFLGGSASMAIMVVMLLIRPEGIFGITFEEERL